MNDILDDINDILDNAVFDGDLDTINNIISQCSGDELSEINFYDIALNAVGEGHLDIVKYLCDNEFIEIDTVIFTEAITSNEIDIIKYFIKEQYDIASDNGQVFKTAILEGNVDIIKLLVENGAIINGDDIPLIISSGNLEILKYLIENGGDIKSFDYAVADNAAYKGHLNVIEYLVPMINDKDVVASLLNRAIDGKRDNIIRYFIGIGEWSRDLDPYLYIDIIDERHLLMIANNDIHRAVLSRKRVYDYPSDVDIVVLGE